MGTILNNRSVGLKLEDKEYANLMVKAHLMGLIDLSERELVSSGNMVKDMYTIFLSEKDWYVKRVGERKAFIEWVMGLPSCMNVLYANWDIMEFFKLVRVTNIEEIEEEGMLMDCYADLLYSNVMELI